MSFETRGAIAPDHPTVSYPGSSLRFRAPAGDPTHAHVLCLGGTETFGRSSTTLTRPSWPIGSRPGHQHGRRGGGPRRTPERWRHRNGARPPARSCSRSRGPRPSATGSTLFIRAATTASCAPPMSCARSIGTWISPSSTSSGTCSTTCGPVARQVRHRPKRVARGLDGPDEAHPVQGEGAGAPAVAVLPRTPERGSAGYALGDEPMFVTSDMLDAASNLRRP
jgi:hypothetical protein